MQTPNGGGRFKLPIILILALILLPPLIMVLTVGTPKTRRDAFISCSETTHKRLIKALKDCGQLSSESKKKRCRIKIKNLKAKQYLACRNHLSPLEAAPTPTPAPITKPCVVTSPESWKGCLAEVNTGQRYMIEVADTVECIGPETCAGVIDKAPGLFEIKIFSKQGTNHGFIRRDSYDYSILTITDSKNVRLSSILFDDDLTTKCTDCSAAVITVKDSKKITFDEITITNAKAYGVAGYSLTESSFRISNFINIGNTAIWLPFFRSERVLSMDVDLFSNRFINCHSHAVLNQGMGRPERIASFMYNSFIGNGNGITLLDPARLIAIENNLISGGAAQGGGGNGILVFSEKGAEPNPVHDIYLRNNRIFNNSGWAVLKVSKSNPGCLNIIDQDNQFNDNQCRGDQRCEEKSGFFWPCEESGKEANQANSSPTNHNRSTGQSDDKKLGDMTSVPVRSLAEKAFKPAAYKKVVARRKGPQKKVTKNPKINKK